MLSFESPYAPMPWGMWPLGCGEGGGVLDFSACTSFDSIWCVSHNLFSAESSWISYSCTANISALRWLQGRRYRDQDNAVDEDDDGQNSSIRGSRQKSKASLGNKQSHRSFERRRWKLGTFSLIFFFFFVFFLKFVCIWIGTSVQSVFLRYRSDIAIAHYVQISGFQLY